MNAMLNTLIQFFQSGGPFMYPILAVLAIGLAITLERFFYLGVSKMRNRRMIAKLLPLLEKGEMNNAINMARKSASTVSAILLQGAENFKSARRRDDFEAAMEESIMEAIPRLEKTYALSRNVCQYRDTTRFTRHHYRSDQGIYGSSPSRPVDEGRNSVYQYFGCDEHHCIWTDCRYSPAAVLYNPANQDNHNHRQSGNDRCEVCQSSIAREGRQLVK